MNNNLSRAFVILMAVLYLSSCTPKYEQYSNFKEGIAIVKSDKDLYSYINEAGQLINRKAWFQSAAPFSEGYAVVELKNGRYVYVDKGINIITKDFRYLGSFNNGVALFSTDDGKLGLIDPSLKVILQPKFDEIRDFEEGYAIVQANGRYGYIDSSYKLAIPCEYFSAENFSDGYAVVNRNCFIDKDNKLIKVPECGDIDPFSNGYANIRKWDGQEMVGLIDKNGVVVFPLSPAYQKILGPDEGFFRAQLKHGGWEYITLDGESPFYQMFTSAGPFVDGVARAVYDGSECILTKDGSVTKDPAAVDKKASMDFHGRWKHRDKVYGVYTIKILYDRTFELWFPTEMKAYGGWKKTGDIITLTSVEGETYDVVINTSKQALEWGGMSFYKE